ncbi:MAG: M20/M25/M40 family metallo-hydrolase [Gemmatimonadota bacterium]
MAKSALYAGLFLLALSVPTSPLSAQGNTEIRVDGDRIKSYIEYLSTDEMMGRQSMTPYYQEAAEWVAAQYEAWGLEPAGDNGTYFHRVPITRPLTWMEGVPRLAINGDPYSVVEGDFSVHASSTVASVADAGVVFVGYGISAPAKGLDEYAGVDVRGQVVLALRGSPADTPEPRTGGSMAPGPRDTPEPEEAWEAESQDIAKIRTAYEKGAAAILLYDPDAAASSASGFPGRRGQPQETFESSRDFLAFTITDRAFRAIMKPDFQESVRGFTTRLNGIRNEIKYGNPQSVSTGASVQLKGYEASEEYSEELGNNFAYNVVAKLPGRDRGLRDEFVVMGGHLDHLGVRNGQVYNGADDNASGTAVAMEVARVLKEADYRPRRTIVFAAWCGEEMGLFGSNYFVSNPPEGIDIDKVVTYFNMDMVGLGDAIGAPGALNFPTIWEVIKRDQDEDVMAAVRPSTGGTGGSDHSAFIQLGIEALALMTSGGVGHPYYHQPEDDTGKIDPEILRKTGQFVLQGTINLADEREVELLIEDRQDLYNALQFDVTSFNPGQGDFVQVDLSARTHDDLVETVLDSAMAVTTTLREAQGQPAPQMGRARMAGGFGFSAKKSFNRGTDDLDIFEGDVSLLLAAAEFVGFGRLDIEGDDGHWVVGGGLSADGRAAIPLLEENEVWIHLASPSETLLTDMLAVSSEPFIVTGDYSLTAAMVDEINEKGVILGIEVDPGNVAKAVSDIEGMRVRLGDTDNLVLCATAQEGMEEAENALYMGLLEQGWTHEEIAGDRRAGGGIAGGNLRVFSGAAAGMYRMR